MLPPTIPTSFVPHSSSAVARRFRTPAGGIFSALAYGLLGIAALLAIGVFLYGRILAGEQAAEDAALAKAQSAIDPATVASFARLRDRLVSGEKLLDSHAAPSNFLALLSTIMPANVRFSVLNLRLDDTGAMQLDGTGMAKNFNALAAASGAFAAAGRIKNAIFSHIIVSSRDNTVSFSLSATIDQKLLAFSASSSLAATSSP